MTSILADYNVIPLLLVLFVQFNGQLKIIKIAVRENLKNRKRTSRIKKDKRDKRKKDYNPARSATAICPMDRTEETPLLPLCR